jgi:signal peptidase II
LAEERRLDPSGDDLAARRPAPRFGPKYLLPATLAVAVVAFDQATKATLIAWLGPDGSDHRRELLGGLLALEYAENPGGVFGSLRGQGAFLAWVALVIVVGLVIYYRRVARPTMALAASLGLLVGGALGNALDRVRLGYVVDFVAVGDWPNFNVADAAITLGVILLAWHSLETAGADRAADARQGTDE